MIGSDPRRAHGMAPRILLLDEISQWPDPDGMLSVLKTSRGKIPDSKALMIGTRPKDELHPFEVALKSTRGYSQVHAAPLDADTFKTATWKLANPSWNHLPDLQKTIKEEAEDAKTGRGGSSQFPGPAFESRRLGTCLQARLLDEGIWEALEVPKGSWSP